MTWQKARKKVIENLRQVKRAQAGSRLSVLAKRNNRSMRIIAVVGLTILLSPHPGVAQVAQISPRTYRDFTCAQLVKEGHAVSRKGFLLSGLQPGSGGTDTTEAKSAVVIVWPASKISSVERLSDLKYAQSQIDALEEASVASQCSIQFQRPARKQN